MVNELDATRELMHGVCVQEHVWNMYLWPILFFISQSV